MEKIYSGCGYVVYFHGVYFKAGMLLRDCKDERTVNWLKKIAPKLKGRKSPVLCAKMGADIPPMHSMTVFLPKRVGKTFEFTLGFVRNQNKGINISAWRVVDSNADDSGWRLNMCIGDESYEHICKQGFCLNYRFSTVVMK